ncbi:Serine/threonine-protein kinase H1-like protein [Sanghuangporus baumii]|uniref:Serine/threonine-protein kinase H1-like protein n=1 Tax=Sanghuangporus baumii TaxID=108892 RepID=A0A9Q5N7S8_SANBA|nr:Serine/threonine-protein kinase H1-like protein [Sanghuangporus baumii]
MKYGAPITCQPSADIWSVGVIVHLMLTGVYPFASGKGDDADQVYCDNVIYGGSVDYNGEHWSNVSNTAKEFMRSLLHKSRRKRTTASLALDHEWLNATFVPSQDAHHSAQRRNAQRRRTDRQASNRAAGGLQDEAHRPNPDRTRARPVRNSNVTSSRRERGALHQNENGEPQRKRRSSMFSFFGRLSKSREKDKEDTGEGKEGSSGHRQHRKLPKKSWSRG